MSLCGGSVKRQSNLKPETKLYRQLSQDLTIDLRIPSFWTINQNSYPSQYVVANLWIFFSISRPLQSLSKVLFTSSRHINIYCTCRWDFFGIIQEKLVNTKQYCTYRTWSEHKRFRSEQDGFLKPAGQRNKHSENLG